jgi:outer membrane protein TolC
LDNVQATFNMNQFTIDPSSDVLGRGAFYPRYNISLRFGLGTLVSTPLQTKIANDNILISQHQINELKLGVRRAVLSNVEYLKEGYKIYRLRDRLKEDFLLLFKDAEKKFSNGEIKIDQYQQASQAYYARAEAVISASSNFNRSKMEVEALIGLKLEEVEGYAVFINALEAEIQSH